MLPGYWTLLAPEQDQFLGYIHEVNAFSHPSKPVTLSLETNDYIKLGEGLVRLGIGALPNGSSARSIWLIRENLNDIVLVDAYLPPLLTTVDIECTDIVVIDEICGSILVVDEVGIPIALEEI